MVPELETDKIGARDFEISQTSSKLPAFFPRKTKCTPVYAIIIPAWRNTEFLLLTINTFHKPSFNLFELLTSQEIKSSYLLQIKLF